MTANTAEVFELQGKVRRIIFRNEANNFCVIALELLEGNIPQNMINPLYPKSFMATGTFATVAEGQKLKLKGKWQNFKKYGWQFIVSEYSVIQPNSRQALIEYLSSGLFRGVGPKTAANIVNTFGDETLDVIKNHPERLTMVSGVSEAKARLITQRYREAQHLEKLMLSLKPFNISTKKVITIHRRYGEKALDIIMENPYRLCEEVQGVGFRTADAIARHSGKNANDDFRIRAGILYTMSEVAAVEGHVYLPFDLMVEKTKKTLEASEITGQIDKNDIIRIAIELNNAGDIIIERDGAVYLPIYNKSEIYIARKLKTLSRIKPKEFTYLVHDMIPELEKKFGIKYAEKQKEAFMMLPYTNFMVITGGPGTGKTTIIKGIIEIYKKNFPGSKLALCAPTGRAAKRMEEATGLPASTIHRLLDYRPNGEEGLTCGRNEANPIDADMVIIDESSMIDCLLFNTLLKAIKPETTLIMVGDVDQLPSVGAGNILKDIIDSGKVTVVRLNEIFRQADTSKIIINAAKINQGDTDLEYDENFMIIEEEDPLMICEIIKKKFREELCRVGGNVYEVQVITPFRKNTVTGANNLNNILQEDLNPKTTGKTELHHGSVSFRKHDKVMQHKNNYEKEVYNGDIGIVQEVDTADGSMKVLFDDDRIVEYYRDELDEIQLAYTTTIHKSQGSEYKTVIIPLSMEHKIMLQRNLIYTGITRAKERVILVGDRKALNYAIRNHKIDSRFSKLKERLQQEER